MSANWYYVENNERVGPVDEKNFLDLIKSNVIDSETYVWKKGFDNWIQAKNLDELRNMIPHSSDSDNSDKKNENIEEDNIEFIWENISSDDQIFILRVGEDRGIEAKEYGPYSLAMISKLIEQKRVNHLTQIFAPGMSDWISLGEVEVFRDSFSDELEFIERRTTKRCPISARVFLSGEEHFFQGVCRDISIGGAQILVANFSGKEGDIVKINMHFEDGSFAFSATGKVMRLLDRVGGFAMRYTDLSSESINIINNYIESYED